MLNTEALKEVHKKKRLKSRFEKAHYPPFQPSLRLAKAKKIKNSGI